MTAAEEAIIALADGADAHGLTDTQLGTLVRRMAARINAKKS